MGFPIRVSGLTLGQAEVRIRQADTEDKEILLKGADKIILTLMRRRTYHVLVIREDNNDKGQTYSIELPAYENDILHALSETGGMPGESAINEVMVLRGGMNHYADGGIVQDIGSVGMTGESATFEDANVLRIPIKGERGSFLNLSEADVTLDDGDVIYIKGREQEVFYTGGLLVGGQFQLPRDYEINVLEAIALAGGNAATTPGAGSGVSGGLMPASQLTILRSAGVNTSPTMSTCEMHFPIRPRESLSNLVTLSCWNTAAMS